MLPIPWGSNPQPPNQQSDRHPTEPPRPAHNSVQIFKVNMVPTKKFFVGNRKIYFQIHLVSRTRINSQNAVLKDNGTYKDSTDKK